MDFFDRHGATLQAVGALYLVAMLVFQSVNHDGFDLVVLLDVTLAPLGLVAIAFIAVPYFRKRRL